MCVQKENIVCKTPTFPSTKWDNKKRGNINGLRLREYNGCRIRCIG
jgi:hypothetical protein